jgi:hypothetical protein
MKKINYDYLLICAYTILILFFIQEIFKAGFSNIRIYQVLMLLFWSVILFFKIKTTVKNNKEENKD